MNDAFGFRPTVDTLERAEQFLQQDVAGKPLAKRLEAGFSDDVAHVDARLRMLRSERPSRTAIALVGQFKAGKSTLINALVGRPVAACDVFELTQTVCRIVPIAEGAEFVELTRRGSSPTPETLLLAEFLERAQARQLSDYSLATAYVRSDLDLMLVDTPGLGATLSHETDALQAIAMADLLVHTLDASCLGAGRDAAMMQRIQEIGLPFVCALTKVDGLDEDETALAVEYLAGSLGIEPAAIFPVSASRALDGDSDPGLERLRHHLLSAVAPCGAALREQALLAQARDIAGGYGLCLGQVACSIGEAMEQVSEYRKSLEETAAAVTKDVCFSLAEMLGSRLVLEVETLANSKELSEQDFGLAMQRCFGRVQGKEFLGQLQEQLETRFQQEWVAGIKSHVELLQKNLEAVRREASHGSTLALQNVLAQEQRKQEAIGHAVNGAAVGGVILLISGSLLPAALIAAPFLYQAYRKAQTDNSIAASHSASELRAAIDSWRNQVIQAAIWEEFQPALLAANLGVADQAAEAFAQKLPAWPLPQSALQGLFDGCQALRKDLAQIERFSQSLGMLPE